MFVGFLKMKYGEIFLIKSLHLWAHLRREPVPQMHIICRIGQMIFRANKLHALPSKNKLIKKPNVGCRSFDR